MLIKPWERGWCKSELKLRFLWLLFLIINPLIFMFSLFYLSWFVRRRREEWWKIPVRERKWRRKDSQGKVGIGSHFSGGKMLSCERIQPKTILLTVREGFMSERRPSASTRKQKSRKSVLFVSNKYGSDLRSNEHYISSSENRTRKNSGLYGIWTYDLCDAAQCSTNWANKPLCWFQINPWNGE